jgi:hypothetical protein
LDIGLWVIRIGRLEFGIASKMNRGHLKYRSAAEFQFLNRLSDNAV